MVYERGDVWNVRLPEIGLKPAVILSARSVTLSLRPVVARITSVERDRPVPTAVRLPPGEVAGLARSSWVVCHDLFTLLSGDALAEHLGTLTPARMLEIEDAIHYVFGLD